MEESTPPWRKVHNSLQRGTKLYTGVNQILLQIAKDQKQYDSNRRHTFKAINEKWYNVMKGEKSALVVFANKFMVDDPKSAKSEDLEKLIKKK